jgi:hypothetical protein
MGRALAWYRCRGDPSSAQPIPPDKNLPKEKPREAQRYYLSAMSIRRLATSLHRNAPRLVAGEQLGR